MVSGHTAHVIAVNDSDQGIPNSSLSLSGFRMCLVGRFRLQAWLS